MLRPIFAFVLFCATLSAQAAALQLRVQVIDAQFGVEDSAGQKTLCLTVARDVESSRLVGVVEDITDCYWARQAHRTPEKILSLPRKDLKPVSDPALLQRLQGFDSQLEFLWSSAE